MQETSFLNDSDRRWKLGDTQRVAAGETTCN